MSQRTERLAGEIRAILGEALARQAIKDPRVQDAGIITFTHVRLSGDLRQARVFFTVHGADDPSLERVRQGLSHASGYLRSVLGQGMGTKVIPALIFEIDHAFEQEAKIESLLREISGRPTPAAEGQGEARLGTASDESGDE